MCERKSLEEKIANLLAYINDEILLDIFGLQNALEKLKEQR